MAKQTNTLKECPDCLGEMKEGKCVDCGWTPLVAKIFKKFEEMGI